VASLYLAHPVLTVRLPEGDEQEALIDHAQILGLLHHFEGQVSFPDDHYHCRHATKQTLNTAVTLQ